MHLNSVHLSRSCILFPLRIYVILCFSVHLSLTPCHIYPPTPATSLTIDSRSTLSAISWRESTQTFPLHHRIIHMYIHTQTHILTHVNTINLSISEVILEKTNHLSSFLQHHKSSSKLKLFKLNTPGLNKALVHLYINLIIFTLKD